MLKQSRVRRACAAFMGLAALSMASVTLAPSASADPDLPLDLPSTATIHLKKLGLDTEGTGRFVGSVDLATGELTGNLTMNATETNVDLLGIRAATIGVEVAPAQPIAGTINLQTFAVQATASFNIKVLYVRPLGIKWLNLVGNRCTTKTPVSIVVSGVANPANFAVTLSGEFEIPKFKDCGLTTPILDLLVSGPGNTFTSSSAQA
jgi:hypothetical protein